MLSVNAFLVGIKHIHLETRGHRVSCTIPVQSDRSSSRAPNVSSRTVFLKSAAKSGSHGRLHCVLAARDRTHQQRNVKNEMVKSSVFLQSFTHSLNTLRPFRQLIMMDDLSAIFQQSQSKNRWWSYLGNVPCLHQHGYSNTNFINSSRRFSSPWETPHTLAFLTSVNIRLGIRHFTLHTVDARSARSAYVQSEIVNISALVAVVLVDRLATLSTRHRRSCPGSTLLRCRVWGVPALCTVLSDLMGHPRPSR